MVILKTARELKAMREAGRISAGALQQAGKAVEPGVTTSEIDSIVRSYIEKQGATPSFLGYGGFPASVCISVNNVVIHGIPGKDQILRDGDIVSIDTGAFYKGWHGDNAYTFPCGNVSEEAKHLIEATRDSFFAGLEFCKVGCRLSDISHAIQCSAEGEGFSVIRDYVGHGVGQQMHEDPQIPNFGKAGRGPRLAKGMVFAIEPMICEGTYNVRTLSNDWTVVTLDGKLSAHYENTVVITDGEPELLTLGE